MFVAKELANTFLLAYDLTETTNPRTTLNNVTVSLGELRHERLPEEPRATTSQYAEERQFIQNYWDTAWQNIIGAAEIYHTPQEIVSAANVCDRVLEVMKMLPHQDPQTFLSRVNDHLRSAGDSQTPSTT